MAKTKKTNTLHLLALGPRSMGPRAVHRRRCLDRDKGQVGLALTCTSVVVEEGNVGGSIPLSLPSQGES